MPPAGKKRKAEPVPEPEESENESENEEIEQEGDEDEVEEEGESGEEDGDEEEDEEGDEDDDEDDDEEDDEDEEGDEEEEQEEEDEVAASKSREDVVDDLSYDVYNLTASSYHAIRVEGKNGLEATIKAHSQRAIEALFKRLVDLPTEKSDVGMLSVLPAETSSLPRSHRLAEKKLDTKWEKFAKTKGITKKKRDRMVFDEDSQEYKPRFGYKGANSGIEEIPIIEVKPGTDPYANPWEDARADKKKGIKKNLKNQRANEARAEKIMGRGKKSANAPNGSGKGSAGNSTSNSAGSYDAATMPGIPAGLDMDSAGPKAGQRGKAGVRNALQIVQQSTASMGHFDEARKGEPLKKLAGKKRSFRDNMAAQGEGDKKVMSDQLRIVADKADKKRRGVTNSLAAYEGIIPDAPSDSFQARKGKGKGLGAPNAQPKSLDKFLGGGKGGGSKGKARSGRGRATKGNGKGSGSSKGGR